MTASNFNPYLPQNTPLFEAVYGRNLISLGGTTSIRNMFSGLNIKGHHALDVGFGMGGVAYYLAEKHQVSVSGVEVHRWMVEHATKHSPKLYANTLKFTTYDRNLPYASSTFDLVYSKGVFNHIAKKEELFLEINEVMKPGGLFVIADWVYPYNVTDHSTPLVSESKESYERVLSDAGFGNIEFRDDSKIFLGYINTFLNKLTRSRKQIEQQYSKELFSGMRRNHEELIEKINRREKFAVRIVARKKG